MQEKPSHPVERTQSNQSIKSIIRTPSTHHGREDADDDSSSTASGGSYSSDNPDAPPRHHGERFSVLKFQKEHHETLELLCYLVFVVLVSLVVEAHCHGQDFQKHNIALKAAIAQQEAPFLTDVASTADIWPWITGPFLSSVLAGSLPDEQAFPDVQEGSFYRSFRILGQIRMRQVRVKADSCDIPEPLRDRVAGCYALLQTSAPYFGGASNEDTSDYGPSQQWRKGADAGAKGGEAGSEGGAGGGGGMGGDEGGGGSENVRREFRWYSAETLEESAFYGRAWSRYPGSGFNVSVPRNYTAALEMLTAYQEAGWMDVQTRVVFLDFILYNSNLNLLSQAKVSIEVSATGAATPFLTIRTAPTHLLLLSQALRGPLIIELLVAFFVALFVLFEVWSVVKLRWMYLLNNWLAVDLFNYALFVYAFTQRFWVYSFTSRYDRFPRSSPFPNPTEFISYDTAFEAINQYTNVLAFNVLLTWLKVFKYLSHVPFIKVLLGSLSKSTASIGVYLLVAITSSMAFVCGYHIAFGHEIHEARSVPVTFMTLYRVLLGLDLYDQLYTSSPAMGALLYYGWFLVGYFILLNLFFVILNGALEEARAALPRVTLFETLAMCKKASHEWVTLEAKAWMDRNRLTQNSLKMSRLPISVNRNEAQKLLYQAYVLQRDAKARRYESQKKEKEDEKSRVSEVERRDEAALNRLETRLARVVGMLSVVKQEYQLQEQRPERDNTSHRSTRGKHRPSTLTQKRGPDTAEPNEAFEKRAAREFHGISVYSVVTTPAPRPLRAFQPARRENLAKPAGN